MNQKLARVEGGRHDRPATIDHHEAVLWLSLLAAGCLEPDDLPEAEVHRERLRRATEGLHRADATPPLVGDFPVLQGKDLPLRVRPSMVGPRGFERLDCHARTRRRAGRALSRNSRGFGSDAG